MSSTCEELHTNGDYNDYPSIDPPRILPIEDTRVYTSTECRETASQISRLFRLTHSPYELKEIELLEDFYSVSNKLDFAVIEPNIIEFENLAGSSMYSRYFECRVESPFDEILKIERKKIKSILNSFIENDVFPFARSIVSRINCLITSSLEDEPEELPVRPESLVTFTNCLYQMSNPLEPEVVFSPNRTIQAKWKIEDKGRFVIECESADRIRYAIIKWDPRRPNTPITSSGQDFVWNILGLAVSNNICSSVLERQDVA